MDSKARNLWIVVGICLVVLVVTTYLVFTDRGSKSVDLGVASTTTGVASSSSSIPVSDPKDLIWVNCQTDNSFECASIKLQIDPDNVDIGYFNLAVIRKKALNSATKLGSLILNPGGPGVSGVESLPGLYERMPPEIKARFDIVSFDPRGVGSTNPIICIDGKARDNLIALDPSPDSSQELQSQISAMRSFVNACSSNSGVFLKYVATKYVARDLDALRAALGDERINYLGYSYGSAIGLSYAEMFPSRIRTMVLDGVQDSTLGEAEAYAQQLEGFQKALDAWAMYCNSTSTCPARNGGDSLGYWRSLSAQVEKKPIATSDPSGRKIGPGEFLLGTISALYSKTVWPYFGEALARAKSGDGSAMLNLVDGYSRRRADGSFPNTLDVYMAISCSDLTVQDVSVWQRVRDELAPKAPDLVEGFEYGAELGCALWPTHASSLPNAVKAQGSPPILLVASTNDPATPYAAAQAVYSNLTNAVLLTRKGEGHTSFGGGISNCIDKAVNSYLISLTTPDSGVECPSD